MIKKLATLCLVVCVVSQGGCRLFGDDDGSDDLTLAALFVLFAGTSTSAAAVTNIRHNGLAQTSLLLGTAPAGTSGVEVSIDGGAFQSATGTNSWTYRLPTGASSWKIGSTHTISVRESGQTAVTTISVRKGTNRDINGDGYGDLVVGAAQYNSSQGRVYIFSGSTAGLSTAGAGTAGAILTGETGSGFGTASALGDVNGDGYADLIVGAHSITAGKAYVFYGGASGISTQSATSATTILTGVTSGDWFGFAVNIGDVNGDGYGDVQVAGLKHNSNQGRVYHFPGGASGIASTSASTAAAILTGEATGDTLGTALVVGDINGDGYGDLAIGAGGYNPGGANSTGRVYIFNGSASGLSSGGAAGANVKITGEAASDQFGNRALSIADLNSDGYGDLLVGSEAYSTNTGRVYIFNGTASGIAVSAAASATAILTGATTTTYLGSAAGIGDYNADGHLDVIVGAYGHLADNGAEYIYQGSAAGIATGAIPATTITGDSASEFLGFGSEFFDVNGDGHADAILMSLHYSSLRGRVFVFNGAAAGVTSGAASTATAVLTGEVGAGAFGTLAR